MSEEIKETVVTENTEQTVKTPKVEEPTVDYQAELVKAQAELKKIKAVADKNASEAADYKKKWRATLDENQQANLAKEEAEKAMREELESLRKERDLNNTEKTYLSAGYPSDLAKKMAHATYDNNTEEMISIQKTVIEQMKKSMMAELTKSMPITPISNDNSVTITQEQFDKMTVAEQVELKNKNPELFKKFTN